MVQEKAKYTKFKNRDVREIYHMYLSLFGQAFDSNKYAITPTKLSQRVIDGVISGSDSPHNTLPINAETRDSSDKGPDELRSCSRMDISGCHSREKRKCSTRRSKGKDKKNRKCGLILFSGTSCKCGQGISCKSSNLQGRDPEQSPVHYGICGHK
ncbi:uncharacterized protein Fot_29650 [Forsythia ovata]|uniref:Uncharacterized protein n=1 Tax=Forsythia ovata TaxID=205694 RepID=A0ABD1TSH3_9LAMI